MYLFNKDITDWEKWGKAFQDKDAFSLLIKHIFKMEGLPFFEIKNTYPGTNAVFDCGNFIIKIYAPKETGRPYDEYRNEIAALRRARMQNVPVPKLVTCGYVSDKYDFNYILLEKLKGRLAKDVLPEYTFDMKYAFVKKLNDTMKKFQTMAPVGSARIRQAAIENDKWNIFSDKIRSQLTDIVQNLQIRDMVYVHGDLTGDNIIINEDEFYFIDFADSKPAPLYYEYPAIVFDLFNHDKQFTGLFELDKHDFMQNLFLGILLHEYGAHTVRDICTEKLNIQPEELSDIHIIQEYIKSILKS